MHTFDIDNDRGELTLEALDIEAPIWVEEGDKLTLWDIDAIRYGGCSSGAFMPGVTYADALKTMSDHGDDVLQYIQDHTGELPKPAADESWAGMAVFYLSYAVELWAGGLDNEIECAIEDLDAENTNNK